MVLRGDHELNEIKAEKLEGVANPLNLASDEKIKSIIGCLPGSIGPVGLDIPVIVDRSAAQISDFVCGANEDGKHLTGVNWERDLPLGNTQDIRNVLAGDPSPDGKGVLSIRRGIEVGHIFQLGTKYSEAMKATVLDERGKAVTMLMGCYGIGVSRIVAAAIEQNNDQKGITWPASIAPFQIVLLPMNMHKSHRVRETSEKLYEQLVAAGIEVLFDDRKERAGVMFADMELIGIPHRLTVGERGIDAGIIEYINRNTMEKKELPVDGVIEELQQLLDG